MELRVNYSLLDSEGVFVKILLNQLETAEGHLWKDAKNFESVKRGAPELQKLGKPGN